MKYIRRSLNWENTYSYEELQQQEVDSARNQMVVKSNALIRRSRFNLTELEQKILMFLVSKIKPEDTGLEPYYFSFHEFCEACGIDLEGGSIYRFLRDTLKNLSDKSIWIDSEWDHDGKHYKGQSLVRWINSLKLSDSASALWIKFHEEMLPYLFRLRDNYTRYQLRNILAMNSIYASALYELLKSYEYLDKSIDFSLDELKNELGVDRAPSYERYNNFKRKVLDVAMHEINTYTDLEVAYLPVKTGRKVTRIIFSYRQKTRSDLNEALHNQHQRFYRDQVPGQLSIDGMEAS